MSLYADYGAAAPDYDKTRQAVAYEIWLGSLVRFAPARLGELKLLDAGCGTGNYAAALEPYVGRLNGIDANPAMLRKAVEKLAGAIENGRVRLERGVLDALAFEAETFDAVMINQVLHHLEPGNDPAFNGHRAALAEAFRVLKPGGILMLNVCSHRQMRDGFWYAGLIPEAIERVCARIAPMGLLAQMLNETGLSLVSRSAPLDAIMQGDTYFDLSGAERAEWRVGDSTWAEASFEELDGAKTKVAAVLADGSAHAWLEEQDKRRRDIGQFTFLTAQK